MNPLFMTYMTNAGHGGHGGRRGSGRGERGGRPGGPPPWAAGFRGAPFGAFGFPFGGPRGRAGRGDVRAAVLLLLAEQPRHGYEIITELVERSEGRWQPSPGSVYPVLKRLAAEGLVQAERDGERRVFDLTDTGREFVEENAESLGEPWADIDTPPEITMQLLDAARQAAGALWQVTQSGDEGQIAEATEVLVETKRALYRVLAGDSTAERSAFDEADADTDAISESEDGPEDGEGEGPSQP